MTSFDVDAKWAGVWIVRAAGVPGCHTYGRSLQQARERMREALRLWTGDDDPEIKLRTCPPVWAEEDLASLAEARDELRRAKAEVEKRLAVVARSLVREGISVGDTADLLELSHQRISQILSGET